MSTTDGRPSVSESATFKDLGRAQASTADCRWITTPVSVSGDYTGQLFRFVVAPSGGGGSPNSLSGGVTLTATVIQPF